MTNNISTLEEKNPVIAKTFYIVDKFSKRKIKKSTPTLLLGYIEKNPGSSLKVIENKAVASRNKALVANFNTANSVRKAKGYASYTDLRAYVSSRLKAVVRYYLNKGVIENTFNGLTPIVKEDKNGKDLYSLGTYSI